jgi:hypothetical protein
VFVFENDYFAQRRKELGMDRGDELVRIQKILDEWYPGMLRAKKLHQGVLSLVAFNAPVASEIRMRQVEFLELVNLEIKRLQISIGG